MTGLFFESRPLPEGVKLSGKLIEINYGKLSPVAGATILSYRTTRRLYLWFVPPAQIQSRIVVPENFLLFLGVGKEDGVYLVEDKVPWVFVVMDNELRSSFVLHDSMALSVAMEEYGVSHHETVDPVKKRKLIEKGRSSLHLSDLAQLLILDLPKDEILPALVDRVTYPLLVLLVLYVAVGYLQGSRMESQRDTLQKSYLHLKKSNASLKKEIRRHNREVRFFQEFTDSELSGLDPMRLVYDMVDVIRPNEKSTFKDMSIGENDIRISIESKNVDPVSYLGRLNALGYLSNVVIRGTRKTRKGTRIYTFVMEADRKAKP
jgi:hypothetical protein